MEDRVIILKSKQIRSVLFLHTIVHKGRTHNEGTQWKYAENCALLCRQHILHRSIYINIYLRDPDTDV